MGIKRELLQSTLQSETLLLFNLHFTSVTYNITEMTELIQCMYTFKWQKYYLKINCSFSILVSIPACHAADKDSNSKTLNFFPEVL